MASEFDAMSGVTTFDRRVVSAERLVANGPWRVSVEDSGGGTAFRAARGVILADGGFQADPGLVQKYIGAGPGDLLLRAVATSIGDGLRIGLEQGGGAVGMNRFYGRCLSRDAFTIPELSLYPFFDEVVRVGMIVDARAKRIVDESLGEVVAANAIATSGSPRNCWLILDQARWQTAGRAGRVPVDPYLQKSGGTVLSASSLTALASHAHLDPRALAASEESFNREISTRSDPPLNQPPFYAIPLAAAISFTMGGLAVDANARVVTAGAETPIDGLYAVGGTMGGLQGGPRGGYIGGLLEAVIFGILAVEDLAGRLPNRDPITSARLVN
jgi:fumarate reductase flavoprotein subunit